MRRWIATILLVGMLCSISPSFVAVLASDFVSQDENYVPPDQIHATREEAISAFVIAAGMDPSQVDVAIVKKFQDAGKIASQYVRQVALAVQEGMVAGYEDKTFRPQDMITRTEAFVILNRMLTRRTLPRMEFDEFSDTPQWAREDVNRLAAAGVVKGYGDGTMGAKNLLTKDQVVLLAERAKRMLGPAGDFYEYVNEDWLSETKIPDGQASWSTTSEITKLQMKEIGAIIYDLYGQRHKDHKEFPKGSSEQKIVDVFSAGGNMALRDSLGLTPVEPYLKQIDGIKTIADLETVMADLELAGFHGLVSLGITTDLQNSRQSILIYTDCYTGLKPDRLQTAKAETDVLAYETYLEGLFSLYGSAPEVAKKKAKAVTELCVTLAESFSNSARAQKEATYEIYGKNEYKSLFQNLDIERFLKQMGLDHANKMMIYEPDLLVKVDELLQEENLSLLKDYLRASVMDGSAIYLNTEAFILWRKFQETLSGVESGVLPADYAVNMVESLLGWDLAKLYVKNYVKEEDKKTIEEMTRAILAAYRRGLEKNTWMMEETKKTAIKKLENLEIRVGYPEDIESYLNPDYVIRSIGEGGTLLEYRVEYCRQYYKTAAKQMENGNNDQGRWAMLPQTINAMYEPATNSITIPAGIFREPFYERNAAYETNLGGIGAVIAHEISHALDSYGAQFDENGNLRDWWTEDDKQAFQIICNQVIEAYGKIEVFPGETIDGELTLRENMADLAGMACILDIAGMHNTKLGLLFENYAKCWRMKAEEDYARYLLEVDSHAPDKVRVNRVLSNFDAFDAYYDIEAGDGMYLPVQKRIQIWNRGEINGGF